MEKGLKAAIFQKDYKTELKQQRDLRVLLRHLSNSAKMAIRDDVNELQNLIQNDDNPRYPKFRNTAIPHDRFNRDDAIKATELAKRILDTILQRFFR